MGAGLIPAISLRIPAHSSSARFSCRNGSARNRCDCALRKAATVPDIRDVKAVDSHFAHVRCRVSSQAVRAEREQHAALAGGGPQPSLLVIRKRTKVTNCALIASALERVATLAQTA